MNRIELFKESLLAVKRLEERYPLSDPLRSVTAQIEYLIGLESGASSDTSKLKDINIGLVAARMIEDMDMNVADKLHLVSAEARSMIADTLMQNATK